MNKTHQPAMGRGLVMSATNQKTVTAGGEFSQFPLSRGPH